MAGMLRCFLRVCCEVPPDQENDGDDTYQPPQPPSPETTMTRLFLRPRQGGYEVAPGADVIEFEGAATNDNTMLLGESSAAADADDAAASPASPMSIARKETFEEIDEDDDDHNHHDNDNESLSSHNTSARIQSFLSRLKAQWRQFDLSGEGAAVPAAAAAASASDHETDERTGILSSIFRPGKGNSNAEGNNEGDDNTTTTYVLRDASSFDATKEVLTIPSEQVVLPGSDLQQQMAKAMSQKLFSGDGDANEKEQLLEEYDECVICMEGFDPTNPRMPTLCGCGQNKTYFHLPCLYQWIEQSKNCPSCRKRLRWEEF